MRSLIRYFLLVPLLLTVATTGCNTVPSSSPKSTGAASTPTPESPALPTTPQKWTELYRRLEFGMTEDDFKKTAGNPTSKRGLSVDEEEWTYGQPEPGLTVEFSKEKLTRAILHSGPFYEGDLKQMAERIKILMLFGQVFQVAADPTTADMALTRGEVGGNGPSGVVEYRSAGDERVTVNIFAGRVADVDYRGRTPPPTMRLLREWGLIPVHRDATDIFKDLAGGAAGVEFRLSGQRGEEVTNYYATELAKSPYSWVQTGTTAEGPVTRLSFEKKYGAERMSLSVVITQDTEYTLVQIFDRFPGAIED